MKHNIREYVFWYHFNKPAWQRFKTIKWTIHYRGVCHIVDEIVCDTNSFSHVRNRQPVAVIKGKAKNLELKDVCGKVVGILT